MSGSACSSRSNSNVSRASVASSAYLTHQPYKPLTYSEAMISTQLPGLLPPTSLGILATGWLEKRRNGAVRGGWARRNFVLTMKGLHYFRKNYDFELFGEERGHIPLEDIQNVAVVPPENAPYGAVETGLNFHFLSINSKSNSTDLFLRIEELEVAQAWVDVIQSACKVSSQIKSEADWNEQTLRKFMTEVTGEDLGNEMIEENGQKRPQTPSVVLVTRKDGPNADYPEVVLKHAVALREWIDLGELKNTKSSCVVITMSDGHVLSMDVDKLYDICKESGGAATMPCSSWVDQRKQPNYSVVLELSVKSSPATEHLNKRGRHVHDGSSSAGIFTLPSTMSFLFLASAFVSITSSVPFKGLMKIAMSLGTMISLLTIFQLVYRSCLKGSATTTKKLSPTTSPDKASFTLQVLGINVVVCKKETVILPTMEKVEEEQERQQEDDVPDRFIAAEKGNIAKGKERWRNTLKWRRENRMDEIIHERQIHFDTIKQYYPQYFHGRSLKNHPVYYEQPGKINLSALKRAGLGLEELVRHYMFITEYLWKVVEPSETGRTVSVLDIAGIGMSDFGGEVVDFLRRSISFTGAHYPERSAVILIVNVPSWFSFIWSAVKPMIDPVTREKIRMVRGKNILKELTEVVHIDQIPKFYGGNDVDLGESQEEKDLYAHVHRILEGGSSSAIGSLVEPTNS